MNREQLKKDIFPQELMLKLVRDIPVNEYEAKIKLVNDFIDEIRGSYDDEVLKIKWHNQIAFCYWMAEKYEQAIEHYEVVVQSMEPEDYPSLYFLANNLLIRGNRLLSKYKEAEKWVVIAFENTDLFNPSENLINLNDYVDLITDTGQVFEKNYIPLIQPIIDELGFPEKLEDPSVTIRSMNKTHKLWAKKLGKMELGSARSNLTVTIGEYEDYIKSCEIEWFRNYARKTLDSLKSK